MSLRNISGQQAVGAPQPTAQSPSHRGVHRSISATNAKPNRRASSGGMINVFWLHHKDGLCCPCPFLTLQNFLQYLDSTQAPVSAYLVLFIRIWLYMLRSIT